MTDGPGSLAESITSGRGDCPLPQTHDRLEECHYWWHQMAEMYQEPQAFRWRLGAFLGAARSVTFMLQAEKHVFASMFWYDRWVAEAKETSLLKWLNENRRLHTHQKAIAPTSWANFRCLLDRTDPRFLEDEEIEEDWQGPINIELNPYRCTHYYIRTGIPEDHPHQYTRYWEAEDLPGRELLEVCAAIYDLLREVVEVAHAQLGASFHVARAEDPQPTAGADPHRLPCMLDTESPRIVVTRLDEAGVEVWDNAPPHVSG